MKTILFVLITLILTSCYTIKLKPMSTVLDRYIGKTENEVLVALGPPTTTSPDAAGGKIITYEEVQTHTMAKISDDGYNGERQAKSVTYDTKDATSFYINPSGKVYTYRTNLKGIPYSKKNIAGTIVLSAVVLGMLTAIIIISKKRPLAMRLVLFCKC